MMMHFTTLRFTKHFRLAVLFVVGFTMGLVLTWIPAASAQDEITPPPPQPKHRPHLEESLSLFTGAATYSYPIEVPPGTNGMEPKIALTYSSQAKWGKLGYGWSISGMDVISRSTVNGVPKYDASDTFVWNGHELVQGVDIPTRYHTQRETFVRIEKLVKEDGSCWEITQKNGTKYSYGKTDISRIKAIREGGGIRRWALDRIADTNGNYLTISYCQEPDCPDSGIGEYYPQQITYTMNDGGRLNKVRTVNFLWEKRNDVRTSYAEGGKVVTNKRLKLIQLKTDGALYRKFRLKYEYAPRDGKSRIIAIEDHGTASAAPSPLTTSFSYNEKIQAGFLPEKEWPVSGNLLGPRGGIEPGGIRLNQRNPGGNATVHDLIDMNGDGLPDDVIRNSSGANKNFMVSLNTVSGFGEPKEWPGGQDPIVRLTNVGKRSIPGGIRLQFDNATVHDLIDINGDGLPDDVIRSTIGEGSSRTLKTPYLVGLNESDRLAKAVEWKWESGQEDPLDRRGNPIPGGIRLNQGSAIIHDLVDMNGDGLPDDVIRNSNSKNSELLVSFNTGQGFAKPIAWPGGQDPMVRLTNVGKTSIPGGIRFQFGNATVHDLIDMNGDGLPDDVVRSTIGEGSSRALKTPYLVGLNEGDRFAKAVEWKWKQGQEDPLDRRGNPIPGGIRLNQGAAIIHDLVDMNGDGLPDDVIRNSNSKNSELLVSFNTGQGFARPIAWPGGQDPMVRLTNIGKTTIPGGIRFQFGNATVHDLIDMNGDGLPDDVVRSTIEDINVYLVALNKFSGVHLLESVTLPAGGKIEYNYLPVSQFMKNGNHEKESLPFPMMVVESVALDDGLGQKDTTSFEYSRPFFKPDSCEFRGFKEVRQISPLVENSASGSSPYQVVKETTFTDQDNDILWGKVASISKYRLDDYDGDGLTNEEEKQKSLDFKNWDSDNDGMDDGYEDRNGLNPLTPDNDNDANGDGTTNWEKYIGVDGHSPMVDADLENRSNERVARANPNDTGDSVMQTTSESENIEVRTDLQTIQFKYKVIRNFPALIKKATILFDGNNPSPSYLAKVEEYKYDDFGNIWSTLHYSGHPKNSNFFRDNGGFDLKSMTKNSDEYWKAESFWNEEGLIPLKDKGIVDRPYRRQLTLSEPTRVRMWSSKPKRDTKFEYDDNGNRTIILRWIDTKNSWIKEEFGYDVYGNVEWTIDARGTSGEDVLNDNGHTTDIEYDAKYRTFPTKFTNALGHTETTTYGKRLRPKTLTNANGQSTKMIYDPFSRLDKVTRPAADPNSRRNNLFSTRIDYFLNGKAPESVLTQNRAENTKISTFLKKRQFLDGLGRLVQVRDLSNKWIATDTYYDVMGRISATSVSYEAATKPPEGDLRNKEQKRTLVEYDGLDRVIKITAPDGTIVTTQYDLKEEEIRLAGEIRKTVYLYETITDAKEQKRVNIRDAYDRITKIIELIPEKGECKVACDCPGDQTENPGKEPITHYDYNLATGELKKITDAKGNKYEFEYDSLGRKVSESDLRPDGKELANWKYDFDVNGNLTRSVDIRNHVVQNEYDSLDRITKKTAQGESNGIDYDYEYDESKEDNFGIGRLHAVSGKGKNSSEPVFKRSYAYDERGRQTSKTLEMDGKKWITRSHYDTADREIKKVYPNSNPAGISFTYNGLSQITSIGNYLTSTKYSPTGNVTQYDYGNDISIRYAYYDTKDEKDISTGRNFSYRLKSLQVLRKKMLRKDDKFQLFEYGYDDNGNILAIKEYVSKDLVDSQRTQSFGYDPLNRLVAAKGMYGTLQYEYDEIGNIEKVGHFDVGCFENPDKNPCKLLACYDYKYGNNSKPYVSSQLLTIDIDSQSSESDASSPQKVQQKFTYHTNGDMKEQDDGVKSKVFFEFDALNRVKSIRRQNKDAEELIQEEHYFYDDQGNRLKKISGSPPTITYYINKYHEEELRSNGANIKINHYYANNQRIVSQEITKNTQGEGESNVKYYYPDHLGSSTCVANDKASQIKVFRYKPFGLDAENWPLDETPENPDVEVVKYKFTGKEQDSTGLYYYGARYYDPNIRRFISPDTVLPNVYDPQLLNRYAYVRNNPVALVDPDGNFPVSKVIRIGALGARTLVHIAQGGLGEPAGQGVRHIPGKSRFRRTAPKGATLGDVLRNNASVILTGAIGAEAVASALEGDIQGAVGGFVEVGEGIQAISEGKTLEQDPEELKDKAIGLVGGEIGERLGDEAAEVFDAAIDLVEDAVKVINEGEAQQNQGRNQETVEDDDDDKDDKDD